MSDKDSKPTQQTDDIEDVTFSVVYNDDGEPDLTTQEDGEEAVQTLGTQTAEAQTQTNGHNADTHADEEDRSQHTASKIAQNLDAFANIKLYPNSDETIGKNPPQVGEDTDEPDSATSIADDDSVGSVDSVDESDTYIEDDAEEDSFTQAASVLLRSYPAMSLDHVTLTNRSSGRAVLDNLQWAFEAGNLYAVAGADDEQRRAFLQAAGGFVRPDSGQVMLRSSGLLELDINEIRGHRIGLITQRYSVWDALDALDNVERTMKSSGRTFLQPIPEIAHSLLKTVGFDQAVTGIPLRKVSELNRRRVAIARAISCDASVIIADNPAGGLEDDDERKTAVNLLAQIAHTKDPKRCVIMLTDDDSDIAAADETIQFND